jgi:hypothetical protein
MVLLCRDGSRVWGLKGSIDGRFLYDSTSAKHAHRLRVVWLTLL